MGYRINASNLADSLLQGINEVYSLDSVSPFILTGSDINSPFEMRLSENPFSSLFMQNELTEGLGCLKYLIIGLLVYLIYRYLCNNTKEKYLVQTDMNGKKVISSPFGGGPCPLEMPSATTDKGSDSSELTSEDRRVCQGWKNGNYNPSSILTNNGYILNPK